MGTYTYDNSGKLTNDTRKNLFFAWNSLNLLQEVKSGSTVKVKYGCRDCAQLIYFENAD